MIAGCAKNPLLDEAEPEAAGIFDAQAAFAPATKIDELALARWHKAGIEPANLSSDQAFLRRAYLDVTGTLPTHDEAAAFLADASPNKRGRLIDNLLARDEFATYSAMRWSDLLRIKAEFPINLWPMAAQEYHGWILDSLRANKPYDRFVRELLTSTGSNFRVGPVNFYRAVQSREPRAVAQAVALAFMGTRLERWPAAKQNEMAAFFSQVGFKQTGEWKEEIVFYDRTKPAPAESTLPDGTRVRLEPGRDPRAMFADWLTSPKNPWLARAAVNRVWSWLMGRGIVHEPDDFRADNPPSNPELLAYLEQDFIGAHFDLKHLYRQILNSNIYQLSSIPRSDSPDAEKLFAFYPVRRLDAEVLIDALCQVTGTTESYSSMVPEPYTIMPDSQRSIALPDGSISSPFLELFGRPPRDTGLDAERNNRPSAAQRLHLLNSTHIERKIEQGPGIQQLLRGATNPADAVKALYLAILSRYPTDDELKMVKTYADSTKLPPRQATIDLAWALINSSEFLYKH